VPLPDFQTYGVLIYSLQERYPRILRSTMVLATVGATLAKLEGQVIFLHGCSDRIMIIGTQDIMAGQGCYPVLCGTVKPFQVSPLEAVACLWG
jgi:hypothetical protein